MIQFETLIGIDELSKEIGLNKYTIYKKIKKDVNNVVRTINSINIKIKTNLNQILSFEQGEVLVRLHLRKINDGL